MAREPAAGVLGLRAAGERRSGRNSWQHPGSEAAGVQHLCEASRRALPCTDQPLGPGEPWRCREVRSGSLRRKIRFLHLKSIVPHLSHPGQVECRQTDIVAGGSALRPKELLTLVKPAGGVLSPVEPGKLQSGVLRGSGGWSRVGGGWCDRRGRRRCSGGIAGRGSVFPGQELPKHLPELVLVGLHRPEHLPELVLVGLHSFDRRLEILDCFGQRLVAHDDGL
nr:hypothetical protein Iba_scaffold15503CG0010 [Ipomoea batatas]